MRACTSSERGFTLVELMIASMITLMVMGVAFSTFQNALQLNESVVQLADSNQNLRAGTNLLVRDLMQAGRAIPIGGIALPSGDADVIHRPSPEGEDYTFTNDVAGARLFAITTGEGKGPVVGGRPTDMVTIVMADPYLPELEIYQSDCPSTVPRLATDGSSFTMGDDTSWIDGNEAASIAPINGGDLIFFTATGTGNAIQAVTRKDGATVHFEDSDPFQLNQRDVSSGSITQILPDAEETPCVVDDEGDVTSGSAMSARRVMMYTYFVENDAAGVPRLMRGLNFSAPTALAGVIEDLTLRYDLVDGVTNPTDRAELPYSATVGGTTVKYSPNQIRKVNVHVGVRSENVNPRSGDYLRQHLSTVISIRNLAFVSRYNTEEEEEAN